MSRRASPRRRAMASSIVQRGCGGRFNPVKPELLALAGLLKKGRGLLMAHALIDAQDQPRALVAEAATEVCDCICTRSNPGLSCGYCS